MKVDSKKLGATSTASTEAAKISRSNEALATKKSKISNTFLGTDDVAKVDISKKAQMANKIRELATPDLNSVDEAKVAHFQKLIDEGKYKVDAHAVADKLVDEHLIS